MAIIPANEKVFMVDRRTNTVYGGSQALQDMQQWYTMQDVSDSVQPYKVFTALLTQSGISSPDSKSSGTLTKGVSYMFSGTGGTSVDFSNVGVNNPTDGGWFIATQTAEPINWDGWVVAYDSGTPVANVLENSIGNVWFLFNSNGRYSIASDALFVDNKTAKFGGYVNSDIGSYFLFGDQNDSSGEIFLSTGDPTPANGYLNNTTIEIRVYN